MRHPNAASDLALAQSRRNPSIAKVAGKIDDRPLNVDARLVEEAGSTGHVVIVTAHDHLRLMELDCLAPRWNGQRAVRPTKIADQAPGPNSAAVSLAARSK